MTKIIAIICEFNPMHLGHKHVIDEARSKVGWDGVVMCVMSGNFTQRCTPAIYDKYTRARAALACGADLVVELPFPWSCAGAEDFARGGVSTAVGMGADSLLFASESGKRELIEAAARVKASDEYRTRVIEAEKSDRELGSAVIFDSVMREMGITEPLGANDKLGSEYVRFGREMGICEFYVIPRISGLKSATEVRNIIFDKCLNDVWNDIPAEAYGIFSDTEICREERFIGLMFDSLRLTDPSFTEDPIVRYAMRVARESASSREFAESLATKKYTAARMRREILFSMLGVDASNVKQNTLHTVLLGANDRGRTYLSEIRKKSDFPIITKPADDSALDESSRESYRKLCRVDELYSLCIGREAGYFMKKHPEFV